MIEGRTNKHIVNISIGKAAFLLFFIQPFLAFILSLFNLKSKYSFIVIFFFFTLFGYTFIAENEFADSFRYIKQFNDFLLLPAGYYFDYLKEYFAFDSYIKDIYTISSFFLISRFSNNYHILMALWAMVFTFFFLKSFKFFVKRNEFDGSLIASILAFLFIFSNNIFNINGVRFNTAAWIAVFVIFDYLINKNHRVLLLAALTPFIHLSYISFVIIILIYVFVGKFEKIWIWLYLLSFLFSEISINLIQNYSDLFPLPIQGLISDYAIGSNFDDRLSKIEALPVYAKILSNLPRYFINFIIIYFIYKRKYFVFNTEDRTVFRFLLVLLAFCNFTKGIPSFGLRFFMLSIPFVSYLCLIYCKKYISLRKYIYIIPVVYSYNILYWFRDMTTVTDPFLLISVLPHIIYKNLLI